MRPIVGQLFALPVLLASALTASNARADHEANAAEAPLAQEAEDAQSTNKPAARKPESDAPTAAKSAVSTGETALPDPDAAAASAADPEDISVGGTPVAKTPGSAHVLREADLARFKYDDPHALLLKVPGVYVRGEDGFGLRPNIGIRGANSDRSKKLTLMEDGVLFAPAPYSAPAAYYFPLMARMRSVRVVKGPASVAYGPQTVGGAIDLLTKEIPSARLGTVDLGYGLYGYNKASFSYGAGNEQFGFLVEGVHLGSLGFKSIDTLQNADTGFGRNEVMVKARYLLDPNARVQNEFTLKLGYSDEQSNETYLGLSDADFRADPNRRYVASRFDKMQWHRTSIALSHRVTFSPTFSILTTLYRHDLDRSWNKVNRFGGASITSVLEDPNSAQNQLYYGALTGQLASLSDSQKIYIGPNKRVFVSQGVQSVANLALKTGPLAHRVEYGLRLHYDSVARLHTETGYRMQVGGELVADGNAALTTADNSASTAALALHATDAISYQRLVITPGVRAEFIGSRYDDRLLAAKEQRPGDPARKQGALYSVLLPGLGAYYGITMDFGVLAGIHRGFSPAPPGQSSRPEFSWNAELGARYSTKLLRAEVIGFYNEYQNLTNICTFSAGCTQGVDRQTSLGSASIYGGEAFAETEIRLSKSLKLPARASYTLTLTRLNATFRSTDPQFGNVREGDELPYVPISQASGSVGIEHKRYGLNIAGAFVDAMRETAGQGASKPGELTDAYFLLDASAYAVPVKGVRLYLNGRNLTNSSYITARRPFGARPGAPLSVQFGFSAEY